MNLTKKIFTLILITISSIGALYAQHNITGNTDQGRLTLTWTDGN